MLLAGLPVGDLCDQLTDLLSERPGTVRLDAMAARVLPPRLVVRGSEGEAWLAVEDTTRATLAAADAPVPLFLGRDREIGGRSSTPSPSAPTSMVGAGATLMIAPAGAARPAWRASWWRGWRAGSRPAAAYFLRGRVDRASTPHGLLAPLLADARPRPSPRRAPAGAGHGAGRVAGQVRPPPSPWCWSAMTCSGRTRPASSCSAAPSTI
jgi:hypothetical protein